MSNESDWSDVDRNVERLMKEVTDYNNDDSHRLLNDASLARVTKAALTGLGYQWILAQRQRGRRRFVRFVRKE